jgi:hypothetical protein
MVALPDSAGQRLVRAELRYSQLALIRPGHRHTFWNPGEEPAVFRALVSPPGLEHYFSELAEGLAYARSEHDARALREEFDRRYDSEATGAPLFRVP